MLNKNNNKLAKENLCRPATRDDSKRLDRFYPCRRLFSQVFGDPYILDLSCLDIETESSVPVMTRPRRLGLDRVFEPCLQCKVECYLTM